MLAVFSRSLRLVALIAIIMHLCPAAWAQSDPSGFGTVIDVPPSPFATVDTVPSDTQVNVLDGGRVVSRLTAGSSDGTDSNIEVNVFADGAVTGTFVANPGSTINVLGGSIGAGNVGGALRVDGGQVNVFDGAQIFHRLSVTDGGIVDISGGTVSRLQDVGNAAVNVSGGTVTLDSFRLENGGVFNITGGEVLVDEFDSVSGNIGSTVNVSGGRVERLSSDVANVSGGVVTGSIRAQAGRITGGRQQAVNLGNESAIVGGEFFLNGQPIVGPVTLEAPNFPSIFFGPAPDVLTGTLADGTPFIFDSSSTGLDNVLLEQVSLAPADTQPVVIGAGDVSNGLRPGQTQTVVSGGTLGEASASVDATLRIEGGTVEDGLRLFGSDFVVSADSTVGSGANAFNSTVSLEGGRVGAEFGVRAGTDIRLAGGTIGRGLEIEMNATATIVASDLRLNGEPVTGSQVTLNADPNSVLTGVFADGTPFAFSESSDDSLNTQLSVESVTVADSSLSPIVVDGTTTAVPAGLRPNQTLTLLEDGQLSEDFTVLDATLNVQGGQVASATEIVRSTVNVSEGEFGDVSGTVEALFGTAVQVFDHSTLNILGGSTGVLELYDGSVANVVGGSVDRISIRAGGEVNLDGGLVGSLLVDEAGVLNILGGSLGGTLLDGSLVARAGGEVNFFGTEFFIDGILVDDLSLNESLILDLNSQRDFTLSGLFSDGSEFQFDIDSFGFGSNFSSDTQVAIFRTAAIPEPTAFTLFVVAGLLFSKRRCRGAV